jgi:hypothetical protein
MKIGEAARLIMVPLLLVGCSGRQFVVEPEEVESLHDSEWTIHGEPPKGEGNPAP